MSDCLATLQRELLPAVVDTGLLAVENRLLNFHLDTGRLIDGTAFRNVCLDMDESRGDLPPRNEESGTSIRHRALISYLWRTRGGPRSSTPGWKRWSRTRTPGRRCGSASG